jgi:hypothetical protein
MKEGPWKCRSDGQRGKPKPGFPRCPQSLEITQNVIPTFPPPRLGVENWKTKSRFPTFPLVVCFSLKIKPRKGGLAADRFAPPFRLILGLENAACRNFVLFLMRGYIEMPVTLQLIFPRTLPSRR